MEVVLLIIIAFVVLGAFGSFNRGSGGGFGGLLARGLGGHDGQMDAVARDYGVTLQNTYIIHNDEYSRYDSGVYVYGFSGIDKAGVRVTGQIRVGLGGTIMTFDDSGAGARAARAQGRLLEEEMVDETTLDLEELVRREVGRRLDTLQANRDAFMAHDTDGDGVVDADEWNAARARIEAQVREELGTAGPTSNSADPDDEPAPTIGDGQW